jgi:hypothetical protein
MHGYCRRDCQQQRIVDPELLGTERSDRTARKQNTRTQTSATATGGACVSASAALSIIISFSTIGTM